jgi:putative addiction module component (TIGR02574 family)
MDADRLLHEALLLPAEARAKLARELISSLDDSTVDEDRDVEWALEIRRRLDDYDAGLVRARPADEVLAELKATASARRP